MKNDRNADLAVLWRRHRRASGADMLSKTGVFNAWNAEEGEPMRRSMMVGIAALALILGADDANAQFGGALSFDGGDRVNGILDTVDPANGTIEAFVIAEDTADRNIVVRTNSGGPGSAWSHQLRINGGIFEFYLYASGTGHTVTGTTTVVPGMTYHVAGVYTSGGQMRLFVNGIEEGTPATIGTAWPNGDPVTLQGFVVE